MYHTLHIYAYHMIDLTFSLLQNKKHAHHIKDIKSHTYTQTKEICEEILYTIKALSGTQIYTPV